MTWSNEYEEIVRRDNSRRNPIADDLSDSEKERLAAVFNKLKAMLAGRSI